MAKDETTFTPSVRKVETEFGETGLGQSNRVETTYEFGFEIDGAWVALSRVTQATVEAAQARHAAEQENQPADAEKPAA